jgi:hypothetical protein
MDGYRNSYWQNSVWCLESLKVDINDGYGLRESLTAPEYYTLSTVETTALGVNGNVMFSGFKGSDLSGEIPQSLNTWINEILDDRRMPIQFYDDLSVVHYREDVQFYLRLSVQYVSELGINSGPIEFTNEGKTSTGLDPIHTSYLLSYVA